MESWYQVFTKSWELVSSGDSGLYGAVWISIKVSFLAVALAALIALPAGYFLSVGRFWGRKLLLTGCQTLMAVPTVVVGLVMYTLLFRRGPLGTLGLLFTPTAMVLGQALLILPLLIALVALAIGQVDRRFGEEARLLGAGRLQLMLAVAREARPALVVALFTGLSRAVSEVGCAMMVGGNIRGYTRNITTAIALETSKGEFALALALGVILLAVALALNLLTQSINRRRHA